MRKLWRGRNPFNERYERRGNTLYNSSGRAIWEYRGSSQIVEAGTSTTVFEFRGSDIYDPYGRQVYTRRGGSIYSPSGQHLGDDPFRL